jgi:beta-galactosidase
VALPFEYSPNGDVKAHGYKPVGGLYPQNSIGWYRKKFTLDAQSDTTGRVAITFDGVFRNSQVWVNNFYCGTHFSGYTGFSYDITDFVRYDKENVIVVRVDASQYEGWFYEGAGIYRHVWLNLFDNLHFTENGIFAYAALNNDFSQATLTIQTEVENTYNQLQKAVTYTVVYNSEGKQVAQTDETVIQLLPNGKQTISGKVSIEYPELWNLEAPKRYKAVSIVKSGNKIMDKIETRLGIRDIRIDKDKGLFLNGKNIKVQGVCCHQDHAGLGSALPDYMQYYRIGLLKEMGVNAYRTSHNPPTPELLEACDSLGMLVIDEVRLLNSSAEYMSQLKSLILRDRNHPSVFMWSIGNEEEVYQTSIEGEKIALSMMRMTQSLDSSRTIVYGANVGNVNTGVNKVIPVRGFNYNLYGIDDYRKLRPDQPIIGSEVASTVTTRGVYAKDTVNCYLPDFDENYPPWASTAEQWWTIAAGRDWFMGGFAWTGFDYRGEPTPYNWPNINSHFGIMDMCGFPKNVYYYYQSWWTDKDVLHIAPHWNWQGKEGQPVEVWLNSNAQTVELFLNGKSYGKKEMPRNGHLNWKIPYKPGKLKAVAHKNGRTFEKTIETTGEAYQIVLTPSKTTIAADGKDAVVVNVSVTDKKGREVPDTNRLIRFSLSGNAKIIGVGNGNPACHEPDKCVEGAWQRSLFNGKCQLIIQAGKINSILTLTAVSETMKSSIISLKQF